MSLSKSTEPSAIAPDAAKSSNITLSASELAQAIHSIDPQRVDAQQAARAKTAVMNAICLAVGGSSKPIPQFLLKTPGIATVAGQSLIFGTDRRTSALDAAQINATAAGAAGDIASSTHEAALVVALIALGEERKSTGKELVDAIVVATQTSLHLRQLFPVGDLPDPPLMGAIAFASSTAAASRLLKLDRNRTLVALLIGATFGGHAKHPDISRLTALETGNRARASLLAALLSEAMDDGPCAELARDRGAEMLFDQSENQRPPRSGNGASATGIADNIFEHSTLPQNDLWDDFERRVKALIPRDQIAPLFESLEMIDKMTDLSKVTRLVQTRSGSRAVEAKVVFAPKGTHEVEETNWVP